MTDKVAVTQADREAAARVFDARSRKAAHPDSITMERHHAKVIRAGEGDDYDAVQAAALSRIATAEACARDGAQLVKAAQYLIDTYERLWKGGISRDLTEAIAAWETRRATAIRLQQGSEKP